MDVTTKKIVNILRSLDAEFEVNEDEILLDDVGGDIFVMDGDVYFVHGNEEPYLPADKVEQNLEAVIKDYITVAPEDFYKTREKYGLVGD